MQPKSIFAIEMSDGITIYTNQHPNDWDYGRGNLMDFNKVITTENRTVFVNTECVVRIRVMAGSP